MNNFTSVGTNNRHWPIYKKEKFKILKVSGGAWIPRRLRGQYRRGIVVHYVGYSLKTDVVHAVWQIGENWGKMLKLGHTPRRLQSPESMWCVNSDFFFNFRAYTTSVGRPEPTWCFYFTSNTKFHFTFLLLHCARPFPVTVPTSSPLLFDLHCFLIALHFTFSCSKVESISLKGSIFDLNVRLLWSFCLKLSFFGFSSIFICFNWFCYSIQYLFVLSGFGRVCLAKLGSVRFWHHNFGLVVFSVLASPLLYKRCAFIIFEMIVLNVYLHD